MTLRRAATYFALVFALGFVLGTVRVLWVVPRMGDRAAELAETPLMLVGCFFAARFVVRRFPAAARSSHLASGLVALALLLAVEFGVVLTLRGMTLGDYLATRDVVSGAVYAGSLLLFACMPWFVAGSARSGPA